MLPSPAWYALINVFIDVYVFYASIWNAPNDTAFKPQIGLIRPVVRYFGLWHTRGMFAPTPFLASRWIELHVYFHDGDVLVWKPDYHPEMTRWQRFCRERFRKIAENCHDGEFGYVRQCLCDYVIRQYRLEAGSERKIKQILIYHVEEPIADFRTTPNTDLSVKRTLHYTHELG